MSRSRAAVLFPDGTIKYAMYCGTSGVLWARLFDSLDEAWDTYREVHRTELWLPTFHPDVVGESQTVQIYVDHGGGTEWAGTATRNRVIGPLEHGCPESGETKVKYIDYEVDTQPTWVNWNYKSFEKGLNK